MLLMVGGLVLTGCSKTNDNSKKTDQVEKPQAINYSGTFKSDDDSSIEIIKVGDNYKANISIFRLTTFDDCTVDEIKNDILTISGLDPDNKPIKFTFNWNTKTLKVVDTTWSLLENGTEFTFNK